MLATIFTVFILAAGSTATAPPDATTLIEQLLTGFEDVCEQTDGSQVRHVRFATLDAAGQDEERLELRTTTAGSTRVLDYIVNGTVVFVQTGGHLQVTPAGLELLSSEDRSASVLAAFAAAHPRILVSDVETPHHSCGALAGKAEELAKCDAIGVGGCILRHPVVCGASLGLAIACRYLVNKVCEENAESCEDHPPGWTEG